MKKILSIMILLIISLNFLVVEASAATYKTPLLISKVISTQVGSTQKVLFTNFENSTVKYLVQNQAIAKISNVGVVQGLKPGKTTIKATVVKKVNKTQKKNYTFSIAINVLSDAQISTKNVVIMAGSTQKILFTNFENSTVKYSIQNTNVVKIIDGNYIQGITSGDAIIKADVTKQFNKDSKKNYSFEINVKVISDKEDTTIQDYGFTNGIKSYPYFKLKGELDLESKFLLDYGYSHLPTDMKESLMKNKVQILVGFPFDDIVGYEGASGNCYYLYDKKIEDFYSCILYLDNSKIGADSLTHEAFHYWDNVHGARLSNGKETIELYQKTPLIFGDYAATNLDEFYASKNKKDLMKNYIWYEEAYISGYSY